MNDLVNNWIKKVINFLKNNYIILTIMAILIILIISIYVVKNLIK